MIVEKVTERKNVDKQLWKLLDVVERLGQWESLRSEHEKRRNEVTNQGNGPCARCGRRKGEYGVKKDENTKVKVVEAAHIKPAEEGGRGNPENLLPLCERGKTSLEKANGNTEQIGCHQLYDNEGLFSRDKILELRAIRRRERLRRRKQPRVQYRGLTFKDEAEREIERGHVQKARPLIDRLLVKAGDDRKKRIEALILKLRCERRSQRKEREDRKKQIEGTLDTEYAGFLREFRNTGRERNTLESVEYEIGMGRYFEIGDFMHASEIFRRYKRAPGNDGGWMINELQACVSDFEAACEQVGKGGRRVPLQEIRQICTQLEEVIGHLDDFLQQHPHCDKRKILNRWRVTARLHLSRMLASIGNRRCKGKLEEAVEIRNGENARSGWAWYTTALLLHTDGMCHQCTAPPAEALQILCIAARWIIFKKYKNYEYLDNILEALLALPRGKLRDFTEQDRKVVKQALNDLPKIRKIAEFNSD